MQRTRAPSQASIMVRASAVDVANGFWQKTCKPRSAAASTCSQWTSGAVNEIMIPRPHKGQYRAHAPEAIERLGELAATGLRDDEIAQQLDDEGLRTGSGVAWNEDRARQARRKHGIKRVAPDRPRMLPLPHQHPEHGWFSLPGAMARFHVSESTVRRWIAQQLVRTTRADFGTHRNVHWLEIDAAAAARLTVRTRGRTNR